MDQNMEPVVIELKLKLPMFYSFRLKRLRKAILKVDLAAGHAGAVMRSMNETN